MKQIIYNNGNRSLKRTMKWLCASFFILHSSCFISSCSDSYMEDLNTDKSKTSVSEPAYQLTFALLSTYGSFGSMEAVRAYVAPYTQMYGGGWNAANAGGANLYKSDVSVTLECTLPEWHQESGRCRIQLPGRQGYAGCHPTSQGIPL